MFDWKSEQGKSILNTVDELKQTHTYSQIVDLLREEHFIDIKLETLKSAMKRRSEVNQKTITAAKEDELEANELITIELTDEELLYEAIEAEKEKAKENKEKKLLKKLLQDRAKTELIIDAIRECIIAFPRPPLVIPEKVEACENEEEALLLFSDAQIGEEIKPEETNGYGEYNIHIFKSRMDYLTKEIRSIAEKQHRPIKKLNIMMLGDNVDGLGIYRGQDHHLDVLVVDQVLIAAHHIAKCLIDSLGTFEQIKIWGIVGNHGRIGKKGEYPITVNWDYLLYKMLEMLLAEFKDRIEWVIPKSNWCLAEVNGQPFLMLHGDTIKGWNSIPFYGIDRADSRLKQMLAAQGTFYRYLVLGHHHNPGDIDSPSGEKILNGTMVGGSDFSINTLHTSSRPSQWYFGISKERGITWRYKVLLDQHEDNKILMK